MGKWFGEVGYSITEEVTDGVFKAKKIERKCYGDLLEDYDSRNQSSDKVNDDISLSCKISIVADPFAFQNFAFIKYVKINGIKWTVSNIRLAYPRLVLTVGGVYNG